MIEVVPLAPVPSQTVAVQLAGQSSRVNVYQKATGLYIDLYLNDEPIVVGVAALNCNSIVRDAYLGFAGDLYFKDARGVADPDYTGLGDRFSLCYLMGV